MTIPTIIGRIYSIVSKEDCTVSFQHNGVTYKQIDVVADTETIFTGKACETIVSSDTAVVTPLPKSAPGQGNGAGANTPTHAKELDLTTGTLPTLRNGGIYTLKQSELIVEAAAAVGKVRVDSVGEQKVKVGGTLTIDNHTFVCKDESGQFINFDDDIVKVINADDTCAVSAAESYPYMVLTAKTAGAAGNDIVLASDGGFPVVQEMSGGQDANDGSSIDLSGLTIGAAVTTAQIWIDCDGEALPDVRWPDGESGRQEWNILGTEQMGLAKRNVYVVINEGDGVFYRLAYVHALTSQD